MTEILTAAIVGLGKAGSRFDEEPGRSVPWSHAGAYLHLADRFRIVAGADPMAENAARFQKRCPDAQVFPDIAAMLAETKPDVVSICTPAGRHRADLEVALACPSVKAVWCEKPLSTELAEAEAMVALAAARKIPVVVTYNRRWLPLWRKVKELLDGGEIGDLVCLRIAGPNRIYSLSSHLIDLMRYLAGDPATVLAQDLPQLVETGEPSAAAIFTYESGAYGILQVTGFRAQLVIEGELIGRKGRLLVREDPSKLTIERFVAHPEFDHYEHLVAAGEGRYASLSTMSVFVEAAMEVAQLVADPSAPCSSDIASALGTQRLIDRIVSASRHGR